VTAPPQSSDEVELTGSSYEPGDGSATPGPGPKKRSPSARRRAAARSAARARERAVTVVGKDEAHTTRGGLTVLSDWSGLASDTLPALPLDDWEATANQELQQPWVVITTGQKLAVLALVVVCAIAAAFAPLRTALAINGLLVIFFAAANLLKLALVRRSLADPCAIRIDADDLASLAGADLPMYSILVPLYHEAAMLQQVVDGIALLDYPADRLDVKILLEEDDWETRSAALALALPAHFELLTVPEAGPKGKPRACNTGLARARGEYLVIYDAEDRPEPDQLRKAVAGFRRHVSPDTVCLQAKLNYFNRRFNVLTRWFSAEYSVWFDQLLPGLQSLKVAIPLGGTSNHFVVQRLREMGGWNPYNVTEDADLGIRIFLHGWKTAVLDTTTYEEAVSRYGNWLRQRSRWIKGYMQTYLYQMRHPLLLYRRMGRSAFTVFQLFVGGATLVLLLNPIYLAITAVWFTTSLASIQHVFPGPILYTSVAGFFAGNAAFTLVNIAGCIARRNYEDVKWAMLSPIYWLLMSMAAYKALYQLIVKPFYWEKTVHGFCRVEAELTGEVTPVIPISARAATPIA
jgi:cellulose synthase/poly-beta-1,6-N-acetylglucosamine synthase-like glycosyltransferase